MALPNSPLDSFIWGPNGAALTPDQIARQREIAAALLSQAGDTSPVGSWTQGAARVVNALSGALKERRADKAEAANTATNSGIVQALLGGGISGFPAAPASGTGAFPTAPAADAASVPQTATASAIKDGLVARGMTPKDADAFVMNFQDESGLNPGINEKSPIVSGSRGGFGLAQWTGPRRRALEAYAAQQGKPVGDTDTQLDFLMSELNGPESSAWNAIQAAPDTGRAAAAIVNQFLRPSEQHRAAREKAYLATPTQVASLDPGIGVSAPAQNTDPGILGNAPVQQETAAPPADGGYVPGAPATSTAAGQRVLAALTNPQPMGGSPMPMQGVPQAAPVQMAQAAPQDLSQLPVMAGGTADAIPAGQARGISPAIIDALSNPAASPQTQKIAQMLLAPMLDPNAGLETEFKRAQIRNIESEIAKRNDPNARDKFGNSVIWGQDADGNWVAMQPSSGGGLVAAQTPNGIKLSPPGVGQVNLGTSYGIRDRNGAIVNNVPIDNAGKAAATAEGKAQGEAAFDLPRVEQNAQQTLDVLDRMKNHPGRAGSTGFIEGMLPSRTSDQVDFQSLVDQTQGQTFLQAFQMLKGSGQITDIEGKKATDAISRLRNQRLSDDDYLRAITDLEDVVKTGLARARKQAGASSADTSSGGQKRLKFNPATGELE